MRISIIIPAHNEEKHLKQCLDSFVAQSQPPDELILVDDGSSDNTYAIAQAFSEKYSWIKAYQHEASSEHLPGKKVVAAFNYGLSKASETELIGKFDADIVLPAHYFEQMRNHFQSNWMLGMCGGLLYVEKNGTWVYESIADKNHIRGPIKLYLKACFEKIGGLREGVGWDTVDILLAKYHKFETLTDPELKVKHLRPTGHGYSSKKRQAKGEALYRMRYGLVLTKIAGFKMAIQAKSPMLFLQILLGYFKGFFGKLPRYVTVEEGSFIRKYRWAGIRRKLS
ncbi:MAG: glycosyltransferase family A protein [Bacteroidota bacterium]